MYLTQEAARISGVSVRTLRHYDHIGLLVPKRADNGYRYYTDEDLDTLQSILFFRYLRFPLGEIRRLLANREERRVDMLEHQLALLKDERHHLDALIETLEKSIRSSRGETTMTTEEKFQGFSWKENAKYENEARKLYGDKAIDESLERQKDKEDETAEAFNLVFRRFSQNMNEGLSSDAEENLELAKTLFGYMNEYAFDCSLEVFGHIGAGYSANPEFKKNIDKFGKGTAQYASDAIRALVES